MAFFPNAFHKLLVGTNGFPTDLAGQNTLSLTAGKIAIVSAKTHLIQDVDTVDVGYVAPTYAGTPQVYLAQGSFHASDKIGPFHGGYQETVKSKGINPKYVHKFYVVEPANEVKQIIKVKTPLGDLFAHDETFSLRLDIKGSAALRFMNHQMYKTLDAFTGCETDPVAKVTGEVVLQLWADQINEDAFLKEFITATVSTVGDGYELAIAVTYTDTTFSDASWSPLDHHEIEPLQLYASALTAEGDPCDVSQFVVSEVQEAKQGKGYGVTLLKDLILEKRYRQEPFKDDLRLREVLGDTSMTEISRSAKYFTYHILHSVPRHANATSQLDADQYLIKIVVTARDTNFETYMNQLLASGGSAVQLEVLV